MMDNPNGRGLRQNDFQLLEDFKLLINVDECEWRVEPPKRRRSRKRGRASPSRRAVVREEFLTADNADGR